MWLMFHYDKDNHSQRMNTTCCWCNTMRGRVNVKSTPKEWNKYRGGDVAMRHTPLVNVVIVLWWSQKTKENTLKVWVVIYIYNKNKRRHFHHYHNLFFLLLKTKAPSSSYTFSTCNLHKKQKQNKKGLRSRQWSCCY